MMSSEALVGLGITVAELGFLCLMLAWAEQMRSVPKIAFAWLLFGAILMITGCLTAASGWSKKRRR